MSLSVINSFNRPLFPLSEQIKITLPLAANKVFFEATYSLSSAFQSLRELCRAKPLNFLFYWEIESHQSGRFLDLKHAK